MLSLKSNSNQFNHPQYNSDQHISLWSSNIGYTTINHTSQLSAGKELGKCCLLNYCTSCGNKTPIKEDKTRYKYIQCVQLRHKGRPNNWLNWIRVPKEIQNSIRRQANFRGKIGRREACCVNIVIAYVMTDELFSLSSCGCFRKLSFCRCFFIHISDI